MTRTDTDPITAVDIGRSTWQGPESEAPKVALRAAKDQSQRAHIAGANGTGFGHTEGPARDHSLLPERVMLRSSGESRNPGKYDGRPILLIDSSIKKSGCISKVDMDTTGGLSASADTVAVSREGELAAAIARADKAEATLRRIAEGNLGDAPWQADYARIRAVASAALSAGEAEPAAVIGPDYRLLWADGGTMTDIVNKHGIKVGSHLYAHPQDAESLRGDNVDKAEAWDAVAAKNARIAALNAERDRFHDCLMAVSGHLNLPHGESGPCDDPAQYALVLEGLDTLHHHTEAERVEHSLARFKAEAELQRQYDENVHRISEQARVEAERDAALSELSGCKIALEQAWASNREREAQAAPLTPQPDANMQQAIEGVLELVECRCIPAYKDRGLQDPQCNCDYAGEANALIAALRSRPVGEVNVKPLVWSVNTDTALDCALVDQWGLYQITDEDVLFIGHASDGIVCASTDEAKQRAASDFARIRAALSGAEGEGA